MQKDFWLPEAPTDFILAVIGEELGFVGIAALLFLYGLIAFAGLRAARRAQDAYAMLIAVGVTALILFQATLNVFAVLGIAPVTGVPLPFVSYGAEQPARDARRAWGCCSTSPAAAPRTCAAVRSTRARKHATIRAMSDTQPRIAIAAGGTAGHVVPALAVADALRERGAEVLFIGGDRAERTLVPAAGYPFERLAVSGLDRRNPLRAARALLRRRRARCGRARALLRRARGSTPCSAAAATSPGPVALAALTRRIPIVLTEADSHLGLDQPAARAARARASASRSRSPGRNGRRYRVTGRPGRAADAPTATPPARRFGIEPWRQCVLVFGGSLGSRTINEAALAGLDGAGFRVLHVTGRARLAGAARAPARRRCYDLREYLDRDHFAQALAASDLVVARAGGSIFEIAAYGRPAILVPYPGGERRPPDARTPRGWSAPAPRSSSPTPSCSGPRLASRGRPPDRRPAAAGGDGARRRGRSRGPTPPRPSRTIVLAVGLMAASGPWAGRRLHLIGVGGAGMSAYARAARGARRERHAARTAPTLPFSRRSARRRRPRRGDRPRRREHPRGRGHRGRLLDGDRRPTTPSASRRSNAACAVLDARRAARRADRAAPHDRGRRRPRQDDDGEHDRQRAARGRARPRLPDRRHPP